MEKTIKYLENGEYHYATVRDVGDLAKLKTDSKDDLVTAINELYVTGGEAPKKPDGYDELVDNVADAIQKQQQMTDTITNMQQSAQLSDAEMEHMKQVQEELHQEYLKAIKELNEAVDKAKADAADLDKKTSDLQDKLDETFASVDKEVSDVHKQLDSESAGLRKDLDDTKTSLESTRKDLLNNTQEFGVVNSEVKELKDKMDRRIWSTDLDPVREQVTKNTTEVSQTKDELKNKADQSSLDLVTNSVENLSTQVKENADGLKVSVKKDELGGDVARLLNNKTNLLLGTRSFSGEDNWRNRDKVTIEPGYYKGMKTAAVQVTDASIYQPYRVKANTAYTFSFFGKEDRDNPKATLVIKPIDAQNVNVDGGEQQVHITTEWQRFAVTFSVDQECEISIQIIQGPEANNNILHLAGFKLQYGQNNTPWEPNEADVAENIEHTESQFNVYSDQIAGIVKKQEKMGDTERQLDTRITETAEGLKQTSKDLQDANGKITEFKGQLESTARGLKTEYEKYTNDAIGQISDSSLNLIHNSAFQNKDDNFAQWQNISAKANIREDGNGLRWVEITQSGMTTSNHQGITSNYFGVKQGKVTVAVDIKNGDKAELDNDSVMFLELYNNEKKRVDFHWVTLSDLGLSKSLLNDHQVHRGLYRLAIDRTDAKYMTVKAHIIRNGDLWFTNFSARLSSIDDGGYTPNPDDLNQQILKMNTKIEEDAEHIALKANSVDVTRDIKSAVDGIQVGGRNLVAGTNQEYIMGFGIPDTTWKDGFAYATLPTAGNGVEILPQDPHAFWYALTPGREYTQTIWFQTDATVKDLKAASITWFTNDGHDQQPATIQRIGLNSYKIFSSYKWPGKQHNNVRLFDISELQQAFDLKTGTYLKFGKLKLEEGNKSTSWAPAPEDISTEIKSAKDAAIQVASDQINIHVNELSTSFDDKLNKRVNEVKTASEKFTSDGIEQVVTKVTNVKNDVDGLDAKVNNIKTGGRNLAVGTSHKWQSKSDFNGGTNVCINIADYIDLSDVMTGDTLQIGITIKKTSVGSGDASWFAQGQKNADGWDWIRLGSTFYNKNYANDQVYKEVSFVTVTDSIQKGQKLKPVHIRFDNVPAGTTFSWKDFYVKSGTTPTDWTPAPEDVDQQISDKVDTKTLESANIDDLRTQGHYFVHNLAGSPTPGWVYVDVTGNNNDRIRQDVYADQSEIHMYRMRVGTNWSGWSQNAYMSDVNSLRTEVSASVKNLGDRVTTEVNSVTTKINDIKVGGRNYLRNSDKSTSGWAQDLGTMPNEVLNSLAGKTITVSADVEWSNFVSASGVQNRLGFEISAHRSDGKDQWFGTWAWPTTSNGKKRISTTFDVPAGLTYTVSNNGQNGYVSIKGTGTVSHAKIEIGNKPTDWSPAPEDTAEAIKTLNTKWDVANGQIQGKVTETDVNNILNGKGYVTQSWAESNFRMKSDSIDLEVRKITDPISDKINNLQVGTRNLLHNTSDQWRTLTNNNGWLQQTTSSSCWTSVADYHGGDKFTYAAKITNNSHQQAELEVWLCDQNKNWINGQAFHAPIPKGANAYDVSVTFPITADTWYIRSWIIFTGGQAPNGDSVKVKDERLVEGATPGSWTPNPDDVNQQITNTNNKIDTQTLDSANIDQMKTQGHYFVKNLTGNPIGGWVYVDVTGNNNDRIRQDVYADQSYVHKFRSWNGSRWSGWEQGAYISDVNNAKTEVTASVKNLGDRVTTEVNSITKMVNSINGGGVNLLRGTADFRPDNIWFPLGLWTRTNEAYNGLTIFKDHEDNDWNGLTQYYSVKAGETYTFSLNARYESGSGSSWLYIMLNTNPENGHKAANVFPASCNITLNENWQRYTITFTVKSDGYIKPRVERGSGNKNVLEICGFKLERGPVATPWTPAPEDTADQIKQLNTKWDVANGQIQGKVTETDVNNILNGKGYVTQSWAQTMFQMKSDSITLQTVRDNITNGIQNQVNGINKKIDTQILDSANIDQMKTQGHYFVKNLTGNPIGSWVYVDVTGNNNDRLKQEVYQDNGYEHRSRRWYGSYWTEWTTDVNNKNIVSQINITPDQIKIASNKIVLDGDTEIKGTAFIPSAAIKDITADKITTGTLDVGKLNIKNLKADDIKTGTLSGITIKAGDEDNFFQTSKDNIYWITNSGGSAVIGKGKYVQYPGLNVFDNNAIYLGSWAGAELNEDGTINDYGGAIGNPKLAIETAGMRRRFNVDSWGGEFEDKPLDNSRIISWVGNKEFLSVERENGTHIELNPDINGSQFTIQKDYKFGAYFGQGRDGNEINFTPIGGMTINGNFRVTGAKNAIVKTSQGTVAINAYETAGYFFGDIGSAKTSDNKVAMIDIESLFKETVNTDVEYQVFLTSYGPGDIWVSERQRDYFVVESELPNMEFGWEIKAKRKGYENTRLAKVDVSNVPTV